MSNYSIFVNSNGYDKLGRPCKELHFMHMCFTANERSFDPSSKCGCVVTDQDGAILSTGYNGPVRGEIDENVPLTRPEKYDFMEHSERNAIYSAAKHGTALNESIFYVTGLPCLECIRGIIQVGAKKVVYGPLTAVMMAEPEYLDRFKRLVMNIDIDIKRFSYDDSLFEMCPEAKKQCQGRPDISFSKFFTRKRNTSLSDIPIGG